MSRVRTSPDLGRRRVREYREESETWLADHEAVKDCWMVEEVVQSGIACGELIQRLLQSWREFVFRGVMSEDPDVDARFHQAFVIWDTTTTNVLKELVHPTETYSKLEVERAGELRRIQNEIAAALREWLPAKLSAAVGLRDIVLDDESMSAIRSIEENGVTPLSDAPRLRTLSTEQFLAGLKR